MKNKKEWRLCAVGNASG